MDFFLQIRSNINPEIFHIGSFGLRYYSLMFVLAFASRYFLLSHIFKKENVPHRLLDKLLLYVFIGTLADVRLGHTLFYEFGNYKNHLLEIILPFTVTNGHLNLEVTRAWQATEELLGY